MSKNHIRYAVVACAVSAALGAFSSVAWARGGHGGGGHGGGHRGGHHASHHHSAHHHSGHHQGTHHAGHHHVNRHDHRFHGHEGYHHGYGFWGYHPWYHPYGLNRWWWGAVPAAVAASAWYGVPDYVPYNGGYGGEYASGPSEEEQQNYGESNSPDDDSVASNDNDNDDDGDDSDDSADDSQPPRPPASDRAAIHVIVPQADAVVSVNGKVVNGQGRDRLIMTPVIDRDQDLNVRIAARWNQNGQSVDQSREAWLQAGAYGEVDFTRPAEGDASGESPETVQNPFDRPAQGK